VGLLSTSLPKFYPVDPIPLYPPSPGRGRGKKKKEGLSPLLDVLFSGIIDQRSNSVYDVAKRMEV